MNLFIVTHTNVYKQVYSYAFDTLQRAKEASLMHFFANAGQVMPVWEEMTSATDDVDIWYAKVCDDTVTIHELPLNYPHPDYNL
jgi:hypothetical protein